jgi:hypothetical protein
VAANLFRGWAKVERKLSLPSWVGILPMRQRFVQSIAKKGRKI